MRHFRLGRNVALTLAGLGLPLLMGAFSIPYIIEKLGTGRFGVLTLIWAIFGYFSLFDFGISKALTKQVAEARNDSKRSGAIVRAGLTFLLGFGILLSVALYASFPLATGAGVFEDTSEIRSSVNWLIVGMPFMLVSNGLRGILEGLGIFGAPAIARILLGVSTFGLPLPLLAFWPSLDVLVIGLVIGRIVTVVTQAWACVPLLRLARHSKLSPSEFKRLLTFGGWMMVSNLVSPLMVFADRFVISASPSASNLAYYTTPFEVVTRLLVVPAAITTVLFPEMAKLQGERQFERLASLNRRGMLVMALIMFPCAVIGVLGANGILTWWLGAEFSEIATFPMQLMCIGVLFNSLAQFPFSMLQALGRVKLIALAHCVELPFYFVLLSLLLERFGVNGAAIAWLVRTFIDFFILYFMVYLMNKNRGVLEVSE